MHVKLTEQSEMVFRMFAKITEVSYLTTVLTNSVERSPSWEASSSSASQEIPRTLCNLDFITAFTGGSHLFLS
jgi:hypothetical protein